MNMLTKIKSYTYNYLVDHSPRIIIDRIWKKNYGRKMNWKNPVDINEKIQWLICYGDTSLWPTLADKYKVREYVTNLGYGHILPKLYGHWEDANDIDFDALPEKFVIKCNHDSGSWHIIDKKKGFDKKAIVCKLNASLRSKFGYRHCEPHYNKIHPLIIAEQFLESKQDSFSSSLIDYKVWCFDGKPHSIFVCYNRDHSAKDVNVYDTMWNVRPDYSIFTSTCRDGKGRCPKPIALEEMLEAASILSKGQPEVRVDFYIVDGKLYFGELTLTSSRGRMNYFTKEYLIELGNQVKLPI